MVTVTLSYFIVLQWLPIGSLGKKASLWLILGTPGVWWIDLQIDGVRKGYKSDISLLFQYAYDQFCRSLAKHHQERLPQPRSIIASSCTSPLDSLYLAAIFDPIFTISYPSTRQVQKISLFYALLRPFAAPELEPPRNVILTDLQTLMEENPHQAIVVYPECTTTNGRAILPFSPSLVNILPTTKVFPVSLRYTPGDITTPIPHSYLTFLWNLLSKPTHCIRVRIAESLHIQRGSSIQGLNSKYLSDVLDEDTASSSDTLLSSVDGEDLSVAERKFLDKVAEALARLGRVKRVGLGVRDKIGFVWAWQKRH